MITDITYQDLAKILELSEEDLKSLQENTAWLYGKKSIPKSNGDIRIIYPPQKILRDVQRKLLKEVLYKLSTDPCMGAGKNSSTKKSMKCHLHKKMLIHVDIEKFFPNIKAETIYRLLRAHGFKTDVATSIVRLTIYRGGLPQGAPTSTQLAKLAIKAPARHIQALFNFPVDITIWVDDIIISGPRSIVNFIPTIYSILNRFNFQVNEEKTLLMPASQEQAALGIRVDKHSLEPDSKFMDKFVKIPPDDPSCAKTVRSMRAYLRYICS